jgi:hypothetical protein
LTEMKLLLKRDRGGSPQKPRKSFYRREIPSNPHLPNTHLPNTHLPKHNLSNPHLPKPNPNNPNYPGHPGTSSNSSARLDDLNNLNDLMYPNNLNNLDIPNDHSSHGRMDPKSLSPPNHHDITNNPNNPDNPDNPNDKPMPLSLGGSCDLSSVEKEQLVAFRSNGSNVQALLAHCFANGLTAGNIKGHLSDRSFMRHVGEYSLLLKIADDVLGRELKEFLHKRPLRQSLEWGAWVTKARELALTVQKNILDKIILHKKGITHQSTLQSPHLNLFTITILMLM